MPANPQAPKNSGISMDQGRIIIDPGFSSLLKLNDLDTFSKVMACSAGMPIRSVPGRSTVRLELKSEAGNPTIVYLKRYSRDYLSGKRLVLRWLRWPGGEDEAFREWTMIHVLRDHHIGTASPVAVGRRKAFGVTTESFVMTQDIAGAVAGNDFAKSLKASERRRFVFPLAELTRNFHARGFIHKDYYLAHIFVGAEPEKPNLFLIDLQRVLGPGRFKQRWLAKDLGSLAYSALKVGASRTDLLKFYHHYSERSRLEESDKVFIRKIWRRVVWLFGRTPKHGEAPPTL